MTHRSNRPAQPPMLGYQTKHVRATIGEKLRRLRAHHAWYRPTVVKKLRVRCSVSHLRDIEYGRSEPRLSLLLELANVYGVSILYLVGDSQLHYDLADPIQNLRQGIRKS